MKSILFLWGFRIIFREMEQPKDFTTEELMQELKAGQVEQIFNMSTESIIKELLLRHLTTEAEIKTMNTPLGILDKMSPIELKALGDKIEPINKRPKPNKR